MHDETEYTAKTNKMEKKNQHTHQKKNLNEIDTKSKENFT